MKLPRLTDDARVLDLVKRALKEDIGSGDVTTRAMIPAQARVKARIICRQGCVVSGVDVAVAVFKRVDSSIRCRIRIPDGSEARAGEALVTIAGRAAGILTAERTALNFMQRMTGIATLTKRFVRKTGRFGTSILDTRKTTPTLRVLEKYAVLCGGGRNHRFGLYDMILIKDNHRRMWKARGKDLGAAVETARRRYPGLPLEVEVESEADLASALRGKPDWILLDNMTPRQLARCAKLCGGRARLEASGGITLDNVEAVAATGVDAISLGCLTHSAPAADLSLEFD